MKKITVKGSNPIYLNRQLKQAINRAVGRSVEDVKRDHAMNKNKKKR